MFLIAIVYALIIKGICKTTSNIEIKYVNKGDDVFLECPVQYPDGAKSIDVRWRRREWKSTIYAYSQETLDREYIAPIYEERLIRSNGATLKLLRVQTSDQDLFTCDVTFNFGKVISTNHKLSGIQQSSLFLVVNEKPIIIDISPKSLIVEPGTNVSLFCRVLGQPLPSVIWYRHNKVLLNQLQPLFNVTEISFSEKETRKYVKIPIVRNVLSWYNMTDVNHGHSGDYKCVASNSEGSSEDTIRLIIRGSIYFLEEPSDKIIQLGETMVINCKATGDPNNITYHWYKNHKPIHLILNLEKRYQILKSGSLRIISVESFDGGQYMCIPTNGVHYRVPRANKKLSNQTLFILKQLKADVYSSANVTVFFKPIPHMVSQTIYLAVNSNGLLPCSLISNPAVKRIFWKKEGDVNGIYRYVTGLKYKKQKNVFSNNTVKTYFHEWDPVTKEDSGLYRCRGFNLMGNGDWSNIVQVIVKKSPYFLTRPASIYRIASGENINIVCKAHGDPIPKMSWSFENGTSVPDSWINPKDGGTFTIIDANRMHNSVYFCKAINPVKAIVARTTVVVTSDTSLEFLGPSNISVSCQLFSATVSWIIPTTSGFFSVTDLLYKLSSESNWMKRPMLSGTVSHQIIFGLIPDEMYQFSVTYSTAANQHFMGSVVTCRTLAYRDDLAKHLPVDDHNNVIFPAIVKQLGPIPDPPYRLEVNVTMDNKLSISWTPAGNLTCPPILYYRVEFNHLPIGAQFYKSFKPSLQKYQSHWQQLQPVLHPQTFYVLQSNTLITSAPSLGGVLFRVRAYALLSVSMPSHSITIDRSLIDIILANEREKIEIERSIASQNKWWPVIFWSLITLVFSSIVILAILIVARKYNCPTIHIFNNIESPDNTIQSQKPVHGPINSQNCLIDSFNESFLLINNRNTCDQSSTIKNDHFRHYRGDFLTKNDVSEDSNEKTMSSYSSDVIVKSVVDRSLASPALTIIESPVVYEVQNKLFHPLTRIKNDVNLYCNCHTYSPATVVKNQLITSSSSSHKSQLMTEL